MPITEITDGTESDPIMLYSGTWELIVTGTDGSHAIQHSYDAAAWLPIIDPLTGEPMSRDTLGTPVIMETGGGSVRLSGSVGMILHANRVRT